MDNTPGSGGRVQLRVHEFIKKLQPDSIKARFQNVRKFITSAAANKRTSSSRSTTTTTTTDNSTTRISGYERAATSSSGFDEVVDKTIDDSDCIEDIGNSYNDEDNINIKNNLDIVGIDSNNIADDRDYCAAGSIVNNFNNLGDNSSNNNNNKNRRTSSTRYSDGGSSSSVISYFNDYVFTKLNSFASSTAAVVVKKRNVMEENNKNFGNVVVPPISVTTCDQSSSNYDDEDEDVVVNDDEQEAIIGGKDQRTGKKLQQLVIDPAEVSPRNKSPVTVQEWIDSLPITPAEELPKDECDLQEPIQQQITEPDTETDNLTLGAEAVHLCNSSSTLPTVENVPSFTVNSPREPSSDVDSHCSSVDSLLDARKPDPEEILLGLGFAGTLSNDNLTTGRIPKRFLKPSQMKGVDIEGFIRQQQEMLETYESGSCGYRGLTGQSHSNPSGIVAKIMERFREHNRETAAAASMYACQQDFAKQIPNNTTGLRLNKFSNAARNVLTKIRCTPGSVLTPDNRKWLESQGQKSPEVSRRLIIGQQSFTFGHDGDLIESTDSSQSTSDKTTNDKEKTMNASNACDNITSESSAALIDDGDQTVSDHLNGYKEKFADDCLHDNEQKEIVQNDRFGECPKEDNDEKMMTEIESRSRERNNSQADTDSSDKLLASLRSSLSSLITDSSCSEHISFAHRINSLSSIDSRNRINDECTDSENAIKTDRTEDRSCYENMQIGGDGDKDVSDNRRDLSEEAATPSSSLLCLHDELKDSGINLTVTDTHRRTSSQYSDSGLLSSSSGKLDYCCVDNDDIISRSEEDLEEIEEKDAAVQMRLNGDETMNDPKSVDCEDNVDKTVQKQYEDLVTLRSKLQDTGICLNIGTKSQFTSISREQRCEMQSRTVREALNTYLNQLSDDDMHSELKNCLNNEVQKLADLVDTNSNSSKLSIIVNQITLLLQNQDELNVQIKQLANTDKKPTACHEMCDHILRRVQELERVVQQNAEELAQMKSHLQNAHDSS